MKGWTDDQIEDLRDYVALDYALDFIAAITERRRDAVAAMIDALEIGRSAANNPEITKPSGAGQATAAEVESPGAAITSVQEASADASVGVQGRREPTPASIPAAALADGNMSHRPSARRRKGSGSTDGANGNGGGRHVDHESSANPTSVPEPVRPVPAAPRSRWKEMSHAERVDEVRSRVNAASTFADIGFALGASRNAISGFVHRYREELGIAKSTRVAVKGVRRGSEPRRKPSIPKPRAPSITTPMPAPRQKPLPSPPEPIAAPDPAAAIPLIEAGSRRCHYPLWGNSLPAPNMMEGLACGMPAPEGRSYCAHHHALTHSSRGLAPIKEADKSSFIFPKRRAA